MERTHGCKNILGVAGGHIFSGSLGLSGSPLATMFSTALCRILLALWERAALNTKGNERSDINGICDLGKKGVDSSPDAPDLGRKSHRGYVTVRLLRDSLPLFSLGNFALGTRMFRILLKRSGRTSHE